MLLASASSDGRSRVTSDGYSGFLFCFLKLVWDFFFFLNFDGILSSLHGYILLGDLTTIMLYYWFSFS